jgi:hypothetical protein
MSIDTYYNNKQLLFSKTYPEFWDILTGSIALGGGPDTGPGTRNFRLFQNGEFDYIVDTILNNTLYFNLGDIMTIKYYLNSIYAICKKNENKQMQEAINEFFTKIINETNIKNDEIVNLQRYLSSKVSDKFKFSQNMKVWNPYQISPFSKEPITTIDELFTYNNTGIYIPNVNMFKKIFIDLQRRIVSVHYYLMVYVYDLTLKMQYIKSEIIKYELVRFKNQKYNLSVIDVIINELLLEYTKLNNEFVIYNPKLSKINYWGNHLMLWPSNINILDNYYKIYFDYEKNMFKSVFKEKSLSSSLFKLVHGFN